MEIREYAAMILSTAELGVKLTPPPVELTDRQPWHGQELPSQPGRPEVLGFGRDHKAKVAFPQDDSLHKPEQRGLAIHFFANHELLALELMALALLRFPEAPEAFRRGIVATMAEEQAHLQLYMQAMDRLGVSFGDIPVNNFFWHCLHQMKTPLDYVRGMSLTFEQANLDYSLFYQHRFAEAGDAAAAAIMERVYLEELGHVKHGWHWLQHWKPASQSMWQAYSLGLQLPLSPARAKGRVFSFQAREALGMDTEFIHQTYLYADAHAGKARILEFNPDCELEVALGRGYTPHPKHKTLMADLAGLMMVFARPTDLVRVMAAPSVEVQVGLKRAGFTIPTFVERHKPLAQHPVVPWGLTAKHLGAYHLDSKLTAPGLVQLYAKTSLPELRRELYQHLGMETPVLLPQALCGEVVTDLIAAQRYCETIWQDYGLPVVFKAAFGAAGQGFLRVYEGRLEAEQQGWLRNQWQRHAQVLVEPWFERVCDLSAQLFVEEPVRLELTRFMTSAQGQYLAHVVGPVKAQLEPEMARLLSQRHHGQDWLELLAASGRFAARWLHNKGYRGAAGVDGFICRLPGGDYVLQPLSEINPRYTMGHVALRLAKRVVYGVPAQLRFVMRRQLIAHGLDFPLLKQRWQRDLPVRVDPVQHRLLSGALWLTDPEQASHMAAVLLVGEQALAAWGELEL